VDWQVASSQRGASKVKLIIQIPCFNEAETLPITLAQLPRQLAGIDTIEWLVIDDGSTDATADIAQQDGVEHVLSLKEHRGLAHAFRAGVEECLRLGADVIVNTDADNQYDATCIADLVNPIISGQADIVIGARPIDSIAHFSVLKKYMQKLGSAVVRLASGTRVPDAPSGFRAISRHAALRLNVFSKYTYTLETIIQAGQKGMTVLSVPVRVNRDLRPSRLVKSAMRYVGRSIMTILHIFTIYRPLKAFMLAGLVFLGFGVLIGIRFLVFYFSGDGAGHIQSLILAAVLLNFGFFLMLFGVIADLISVNRRLLEDVQWRLRKLERNEDKEGT